MSIGAIAAVVARLLLRLGEVGENLQHAPCQQLGGPRLVGPEGANGLYREPVKSGKDQRVEDTMEWKYSQMDARGSPREKVFHPINISNIRLN